MHNRVLFALIGAAVLALLVRASVFTVSEGQGAIESVGGEIVDTHFAPGLHFKVPLVDQVSKFDERVLTQFYPDERFLTHEQEQLNVDFYVKWRIVHLRRYYEATGGSEDVANARLGETIEDAIKSVVTQRTLPQVITADRTEFTRAMMKTAAPAARGLGVRIVDVRITKIDLPSQVRDSVFDRMRATFKAQAAKLRAQGLESAETTRAKASKEQTEILAAAGAKAQEIRGAGDAKASQIYALAYSQDPSFYAFYRSMQAYRDSIGTPGDVLVVSPKGEYFKYFSHPGTGR